MSIIESALVLIACVLIGPWVFFSIVNYICWVMRKFHDD